MKKNELTNYRTEKSVPYTKYSMSGRNPDEILTYNQNTEIQIRINANKRILDLIKTFSGCSKFIGMVCFMLFSQFAAAYGIPNDECSGALSIACGQYVTGDTEYADDDDAPQCMTSNGDAGGMWYKFIGTGNCLILSTCNDYTDFNTKLRVYTGDCGDLECVIGNNDDESCEYDNNRSTVTFSSTLGTTYYVLIHGKNNSQGDFKLTMTCSEPLALDCPGSLTYYLSSGECSELVNLDIEVEGNCGQAEFSSSTNHSPNFNEFSIGVTDVAFELTVNNIIVESCSFKVTVIENEPDDSWVCGDQINVSLDKNCEYTASAGDILNGNHYSCFEDYDVFIMECQTCDPIDGSPKITSDYIGETLVIKVMDPETGQNCWGYVLVEDKTKPDLCCVDFTMSCTADTNPDNISGITKTYPYIGEPVEISDADEDEDEDGVGKLTIEVEPDCYKLDIIDINVSIVIEHENIGDLSAEIESPDGTVVQLFNTSNCNKKNAKVTFDEEAIKIYNDFKNQCNNTIPAKSGTFQPKENLSDYYTSNASGTWTIRVFDEKENDITGEVKAASLEIEADYANPVAKDNCDGELEPTYTDVVSETNCNEYCYKTITRTWCATDASGNETCCTQTICLTRPDLYEDIECPTSPLTLHCEDLTPEDLDINGHPAPSVTGQPNYKGTPVNNICGFSLIPQEDPPYSDLVVQGDCEGNVTYKRTWMIWDNCIYQMRMCEQTIIVVDDEDPEVTCPLPITVPVGYDCIATVYELPEPNVEDFCSNSNTHYTATTTAGVLTQLSNGKYKLSNLPVNTTATITYKGFDGCDNFDVCSFDVTAKDQTNPTAICHTPTVGLSTGATIVFASSFDAGSYDNCGVEKIEVRRVKDCEGNDLDDPFGDFVEFTCCDIGNLVEVEMKVTDIHGLLSNICSVDVEAQDLGGPFFTYCPDDVNLTCDQDKDNLLNTGGSATASSVCEDITPTYVDSGTLNCGEGTITRTWTAIQGGFTITCTQLIHFTNPTPFDPVDDVVPPPVEVLVDCDDLSTLQGPDFSAYQGCDKNMIGVGIISNLVIPISGEDFCFKILRKWGVYYWCDPEPTVPVAIYNQTIKVIDEDAPVLDCDVESALVDEGEDLEFEVSATDCTDAYSLLPDVTFTYAIYQGNDGGLPEVVGTGTLSTVNTGPLTDFPVGEHLVTFTATDFCGNEGSCSIVVTVKSLAPPTFNVSGGIANEEGNEIEYVNVEVEGLNMLDVATTGNDGTFSFNLESNSNYTITPERDDNILNGVSTYDLVLISKHILQFEMLPNPYKIIAADVNHSGTVSTIDLVSLRKVILFIEDYFPNNTSWRFVDADFVFPDPTDPFATSFPEIFTINGLSEDEVANFVGVKIGDVNCSAAANDLMNVDDRNADGELVFTLADQDLTAGETYQFDFEAKDFDQVEGFQFTLNYNPEAIVFNEVNARDLDNISEGNFGLHKLNDGIITASWNANSEAQSLENGKVLFSFSFTAMEDGQLSDLISLNSRFTKAEAYDNRGVLDLSLQFVDENGAIAAEQFELYQNQPNPFKDETVVGFYLPESGKATFTVYDISGRVIKSIEDDYSKGYNEISINRSELQSSGVLYYQLENAEHIASKKMVLID